MNFALLWIAALLSALLWVAFLVACAARLRSRLLRVAADLFAVGFPLLYFFAFAWFGYAMKYGPKVEPNYFTYFMSLLITYIVTVVVVLIAGLRRRAGIVPAATWARTPLLIAMVIATSISYMIVLDIDLAIRARCAILSVDVNALYMATQPAITSDDQNAALIYEKVYARLDAAPPTGVKNPPIGDAEKFDPAEPETLTYLAKHQATIALLHKAATMPGCRFDLDLGNPNVDRVMGSTTKMRRIAELLRLHARDEIAHGRASSAVADAAAAIQLARHCGQRPMLISALTTYGLNAVGAKTLEEVLPSVKTKDDLATLQPEDPTHFRRILQQAWRSEERFFLNNLTVEPAEVGVPASTYPPTGNGMRQVFFRVFVLNPDGYIHLMERLQNLSLLPYYQAIPKLEQDTSAKSDSIFTSILADALPREFRGCARGEAETACIQVAVAITRFRLDHGSLPAQLADLVPDYLDEIPLDPFDGHELRLVRKEKEMIIYSIGPDGVDDGGKAMDDQQKGDITFRLPL